MAQNFILDFEVFRNKVDLKSTKKDFLKINLAVAVCNTLVHFCDIRVLVLESCTPPKLLTLFANLTKCSLCPERAKCSGFFRFSKLTVSWLNLNLLQQEWAFLNNNKSKLDKYRNSI